MLHVVVLTFFLLPFFSFCIKRKFFDLQNVFFLFALCSVFLQLLPNVAAFILQIELNGFLLALARFFLSCAMFFSVLYILALSDELFFARKYPLVIFCAVLIVFDVCAFVFCPVFDALALARGFAPASFLSFSKIVSVAKLCLIAVCAFFSVFCFFFRLKQRSASSSAVVGLLAICELECCAAAILPVFNHAPDALFAAKFGGILFAFALLFAYITVQDPNFSLDEITLAFNKTTFLAFCRREMLANRKINILIVNIEKFARVNQLYGHDSANSLLRECAERLARFAGARQVFRATDTDFVVACNSNSAFDAMQKAICDEIGSRYRINDVDIDVVYSICGLHDFNVENFYYTINDFITYALREAKKNMRGGVYVLTDKDVENYRLKIYYGAELQNIIDEKKIAVFYQPIYCIKTGKFDGAEALVRFPRADGSMFPVGEMIMRAEENMLIVPLGDLIREKVCAFVASRKKELSSIKFIDINLSPAEVIEKNILQKIESSIKRFCISPEKINMEITETAATALDDSLVMLMENLNKFGIEYLMDDFGTGYANFDFIATLNFKMIKIDRTMVLAAEKNERNRIVLDGMIDIIHKMGAYVVVEGIETESQLEMMKKMRADYIQGFYFSPPLSEEKYLAFVAEKNQDAV